MIVIITNDLLLTIFTIRPSVLTPSATATLNKELLLEPAQEPISDPVPQQFKRVREDNENTCARTDLVYVHPPAHEKKAITDPQKVSNNCYSNEN